MKITKIEMVRTNKPIPLAGEYRPAWTQPDGVPQTSFIQAFHKISTDEGIIGYGPVRGDVDEYVKRCLIGSDPFMIEKFWKSAMLGNDTFFRGSYGGIDIALWDIAGKASGQPVYKILGAISDKVKVYAATSRLCSPEEHVEQIQYLMSLGFKAIKLRLHRPDFRDDIKVVEAVRKACGDELIITVDCNQNHRSTVYQHWTWQTALTVGRELQDLGVYFFEEPLRRHDYDGLTMLSDELDMYIAGGEHSQSIYDYREHLRYGSYDILQPDPVIGDIGITGLRKLGHAAEFFDRMIIPHVSSLGALALSFAAAAAAVAGLRNCPMVEFPFDPPFLTTESQQFYIRNKFVVDADGYITLPDIPGIGVDIDESALAPYM